MDRSLVFSSLLLDPEFAKLESRVSSHVVTDVLAYARRTGTPLHLAVGAYLDDVRTRGTLTDHAAALASAADRQTLADANAALFAWTSRRTGTRL